MIPRSEPTGNRILDALPQHEQRMISPYLTTNAIKSGDIVHKAGEVIREIYFPTSCVFSVLMFMEDGSGIEVTTTGREGLTSSLQVLLGAAEARYQTVCQIAGDSKSIAVDNFKNQLAALKNLRRLSERYALSTMSLMGQSVGCNRLHTLAERCARWLLITHDRVGADDLYLTQEFLASMLGVHRPAVSLAAATRLHPLPARTHQDSRSRRAGNRVLRVLCGRIRLPERYGLAPFHSGKTGRMPDKAEPRPALLQKLAAELIGTFFATLVPTVVDIVYYTGGHVDYVSRWLARGFITVAMIYAFSEISGAHINPAISFGFAVRRVMPVRLMLCYWAAQFGGGFLASMLVYRVWGPLIALGASHPGVKYTHLEAVIAEIVLTFLVMIVILGCAEQEGVVGKQAALAVGLTVACCGFFAGPISGASMNPGRSIPPQIFGQLYDIIWIYAAGPCAGAALAAGTALIVFGAPKEGERKAAHGR